MITIILIKSCLNPLNTVIRDIFGSLFLTTKENNLKIKKNLKK